MIDLVTLNDVKINASFFKDENGLIYCEDAVVFLNNLPSRIADIVFLDPPFNLGKKYGDRSENDDLLPQEAYSNFIHEVLTESIRVLKPGGALYLYHIPQWAFQFATYLNERLTFRQWIAISMKNGFVRPGHLYPAHYALLCFSKGEPSVFNRPKISASRCRHCHGYIKDYGGYVKYIDNGINLSDVWDDLSPVRHAKSKNRPSNEMPIELLRRVVHISGSKKGLLIDPFVGSGTSIIPAVEMGMSFLVNDREMAACQVARDRYIEFI